MFVKYSNVQNHSLLITSSQEPDPAGLLIPILQLGITKAPSGWESEEQQKRLVSVELGGSMPRSLAC